MAKVTGFTAQRMLEIEQASVVDAAIEGADELVFYTRGGKRIRAGVIKGGTAEWIEEYKPIVDNSAEKVGELLQNYNDMSELFVEVDKNLGNLDQDLEDMHTRVEDVSKNALDALQNANAAVQTASMEYAISQSHTEPPLSGWAKEQPAPQAGDVVWSRLVIKYGSGYVERSEPSPMTGWVGDDGIPGKDGVGLTKTDISYAKSSSGTVSPSSGWQTAVPTSTPGQFLWTRTVWTYTDTSTETGYSVAMWGATGAKGDSGVDGATLRIDSSRGTTFKHSNINTVLSVTVIKGGHTVTDIQGLWEAFGTGAFLEWSWRREEDEEFGLLSVMDSRLSNAGFTLTVSPDDVDEKTIFMCTVHA